MRRAERACLELALCTLRRSVCGAREPYFGMVDMQRAAFAAQLYEVARLFHTAVDVAKYRTGDRVMRARLALFLRATLRAERGDEGLWWTCQFPLSKARFSSWDVAYGRGPVPRLARPLWVFDGGER